MFRILKKTVYNENVFELEILAPQIAQKALPGQFAIFITHEKGERVPFTIADWNKEKGSVFFVIQALGKTSLALLKENITAIPHLVGPLGQPSFIEKNVKKAIFIGGGLGIAPLYPIMKAFQNQGTFCTGIIGFRNKDLIFWEDKISSVSSNFILTTDDGSAGKKGRVSDAFLELLEKEKVDLVYAIGPLPMMKSIAEITRPLGIKTIVSLNPIMVDGIGMCGACRVTVGGITKYACIEGPEFDAKEVDFEELILRSKQFKEQEELCLREYLKKK